MIVRDQPSIFKVLFSWRGTILPKILPSLGVVMLISAIIGGVEYINLYRFPEIPLVGFTLIGVVLSIFLGFKNTACYDRWWEARKIWGLIVNYSRSWAREVLTMILPNGYETPELQKLQHRLLYRHIAFVKPEPIIFDCHGCS